MRTVPLHGAKAASRVTRVDDGQDYELVIAYRWHVQEEQSVKRGRLGPYARTNIRLPDGRRTSIKMHQLLMPEVAGVDHVDGDGLNNQRITNLREATTSQNGANQQPRLDRKSTRLKSS